MTATAPEPVKDVPVSTPTSPLVAATKTLTKAAEDAPNLIDAMHKAADVLGVEPGLETTEYAITKKIVAFGTLLTSLGAALGMLQGFFPAGTALPPWLAQTLLILGVLTVLSKAIVYTVARNNRKVQNDRVLMDGIAEMSKTFSTKLALLVFLLLPATLLAGCFSVQSYDAQTVKNVQAAIDFEEKDSKLVADALTKLNADRPTITSFVARHNAHKQQLSTWLIMEASKKKDDTATPPTSGPTKPGTTIPTPTASPLPEVPPPAPGQ